MDGEHLIFGRNLQQNLNFVLKKQAKTQNRKNVSSILPSPLSHQYRHLLSECHLVNEKKLTDEKV